MIPPVHLLQHRKQLMRVAKAVLATGDPDVLLDLRKLNGNPRSTHFDNFWEELSLFLDEVTPAVDDRRHGEVLHMPIAISVRHLREIIKERFSENFSNKSTIFRMNLQLFE